MERVGHSGARSGTSPSLVGAIPRACPLGSKGLGSVRGRCKRSFSPYPEDATSGAALLCRAA
eukprot:9289441-Alexandrium_andersonii.AAC.1